MEEKQIWVLWNEDLVQDSPAAAWFFTDREEARQEGVKLASRTRRHQDGYAFTWGPPDVNPGLPRYQDPGIQVADLALWPGHEVLWETAPDSSRRGYWMLTPGLMDHPAPEPEPQPSA